MNFQKRKIKTLKLDSYHFNTWGWKWNKQSLINLAKIIKNSDENLENICLYFKGEIDQDI